MSTIQQRIQALDDEKLLGFIDDFEWFEKDAQIGDCSLRAEAEELGEEFKAPHNVVMWMHMIAFEAYRELYRRSRARIADLEADLERMTAARNRDHQQALMNGAALAAERERREAAEAELAVKRGRREAAEVILREMAKLYSGQIDNTGNYCNQLHDSARAHFERYEKEPT